MAARPPINTAQGLQPKFQFSTDNSKNKIMFSDISRLITAKEINIIKAELASLGVKIEACIGDENIVLTAENFQQAIDCLNQHGIIIDPKKTRFFLGASSVAELERVQQARELGRMGQAMPQVAAPAAQPSDLRKDPEVVYPSAVMSPTNGDGKIRIYYKDPNPNYLDDIVFPNMGEQDALKYASNVAIFMNDPRNKIEFISGSFQQSVLIINGRVIHVDDKLFLSDLMQVCGVKADRNPALH